MSERTCPVFVSAQMVNDACFMTVAIHHRTTVNGTRQNNRLTEVTKLTVNFAMIPLRIRGGAVLSPPHDWGDDDEDGVAH